MRPIDFSYTVADETLIAYSRVPLEERLRWLEELAVFTALWRAAPPEPAQSTDAADGD